MFSDVSTQVQGDIYSRDLKYSVHVCVFVHRCANYETVRHTSSLLVNGTHTHTHTRARVFGIKQFPVYVNCRMHVLVFV
jgi:ribosomal protein S13